MQLQVHISDENGSNARMLSFESSPVRIGRNPQNEIVLNYPFVSQFHAQVRFHGDSVVIIDNGSTNGTKLNGKRLESRSPTPLRSADDAVQIGTIVIYFNITEATVQVTGPPPPPPVELPPPAMAKNLEVRIADSQSGEERAFIFESSPIRLGRSELNEVVLNQAYVSQWHALVRFTARGEIIVMDLGSTNGTRVNNVRLQSRSPMQLSSTDDMVQIGRVRVSFGFTDVEPPPSVATKLDSEQTSQHFDAAKWLRGLKNLDNLPNQSELMRSMDRVRLLLETFGRSYIELRNGFDQFANEMGLNITTESTPLNNAGSYAEVLDYLLETEAEGADRVAEVRRAFTDLALHQVALLNGVMAGVRELLNELSPGEGQGMFRSAAVLAKIEEKRKSMLEEDRFARVIFGKAFAKAYFAVTGGSAESRSTAASSMFGTETPTQPSK